jgi:selenocysteine lyase/cysteine desulfurase
VRIIGHATARAGQRMPTVSFVVQGQSPEAIVHKVDTQGIGIRFGDFYATRLIESLGLAKQGGVVRVSMAHYNTTDEITRLINALELALA